MEGDKPLDEIIAMMKQVLDDNPFARCYLKWTCPGCGKRVTSEQPNAVFKQGMRHNEDGCNTLYTGPLWGLMVEAPLFDGDESISG